MPNNDDDDDDSGHIKNVVDEVIMIKINWQNRQTYRQTELLYQFCALDS